MVSLDKGMHQCFECLCRLVVWHHSCKVDKREFDSHQRLCPNIPGGTGDTVLTGGCIARVGLKSPIKLNARCDVVGLLLCYENASFDSFSSSILHSSMAERGAVNA